MQRFISKMMAVLMLSAGFSAYGADCDSYDYSTIVTVGEKTPADLEQISAMTLGGDVQICQPDESEIRGAVINTRATAVSDGKYFWVDSNLQKNVLGYYLSFSQDDGALIPYPPGADDFLLQPRGADNHAGKVKFRAQVHLKLNEDLKPGRHQINALYLSDARYTSEQGATKSAAWGVFHIPTLTVVNNSLTCHVNDLSVTLPTLSKQVLRRADERAGSTPFEIEINCNNEVAVDVTVTMTDALDSTNKTTVLTNSGSAQGVGVAIVDNGTGFSALSEPWPLTIGASSSVVTYKLPLRAAYQRLGTAKVSQGSVSAKSTVTVTYQ